jgi:hypothetical protein
VSRASALFALSLGAALVAPMSLRSQDIADAYRDDANRLIDAALANHDAYARLTELVDLFGHRVSGSVALEQAIAVTWSWCLIGSVVRSRSR